MCGGFGLLLILVVVAALREAVAMTGWPVAKGRVVSSGVEDYKAVAGAGNFGGTRARMTLYRAAVVYEYEVGGRRFRNDRIAQSPGFDRGVRDFAERIAQRYPRDRAIDVRFNPQRPAESVLEPRVRAGWIVAALIAVLLLGLAVHIYAGSS